MDHIKLLNNIGELTEIFTESVNIETFLQKIVIMVAKHLKADVCSIYMYHDDEQQLILKATHGLNPASTNKVKLRLGEGLVGLALKERRPVCEKVASRHPNFKFIEGIFEERYESFLAVPILRGISEIGVLVLQREKRNCFKEEEAMALRVVASQLASIIEHAKLLMIYPSRHEDSAKVDGGILEEKKFIKGKVASEGFALARAIVLEKSILIDSLFQEHFDGSYTLEDFIRAVNMTENQLETLQERVEEKLSDVASLIFTAHLLILKDNEFTGRMAKMIEAGQNPPKAVMKVAKKYIEIFSQSTNPYLQEKVHDIKDLVLRLMRNLLAHEGEQCTCQGQIIIAEQLFPSDLLKLYSEKVSGIILVTGGVTSHLAILARSLEIPMIIADVPELLMIPLNTRILLDAEIGNIYLNPSEEIISNFKDRNAVRAKFKKRRGLMKSATLTKDGTKVRLLANINLLTDVKLARELKAEGVGLYRTEFPFLIRNNFPSEEEQFIIYQKLVEGMSGKVVTFRTLDIGGDKVLSYYHNTREENPFLGMRSIRFSLQNKDVFRQQIRAMLRAGSGADINIMFPMISSLDEFQDAKEVVLECLDDLQKVNVPHNGQPKIGMMVEIPSVMDIIDDLADEADFFSIGTNDFIQYMLAADRTNEKVAQFYLPHHPSVLRAIKKIVDAAQRHEKEVSICGDMVHNEKYLPYFLGIGVRIFSLNPAYLPKIQKAISKIQITEANEQAGIILHTKKVSEISRMLGISTAA